MHGDAVPEDVYVPPALGKVRRRRVAAEQVVDKRRRDGLRRASKALKQQSSTTEIQRRQIDPKKSNRGRVQLVGSRDTLLYAADPDRAISKGDVVDADERDFTPPQAVAVDEVEQQPISNVLPRDRGEGPFDLFLRYVAHAGRARRRDVSFFRH